MRKTFVTCMGLAACLFFPGCGASKIPVHKPAVNGPSTPEMLRSGFEKALRSGDMEKVLAFWYWDPMSTRSKNTIKENNKHLIQNKVKDVLLKDLTEGQTQIFHQRGLKLRHTLEPLGNLDVVGAPNNAPDATSNTLYPYGQKDGVYYVLAVFPTP